MSYKALLFIGVGVGLLAGCPPRAKSSRPGQDAGGAAVAAQPSGPAPAIAFDEREFDAGTVKQGEVIEHTFVVKNRGLGELIIEKVKGS